MTDNRSEGVERRQEEATRTDQGSPADWSDVDEKTAKTILRQGELFLNAQLQIALAADQRALIAASIFSGFATAVLATTFGYWAQAAATAPLIAGFVAAAAMFAGSLLCMWAARPIGFPHSGSEPKNWAKMRNASLNILAGLESKNYQKRIEVNDASIKSNAKFFKLGLFVGVAAPGLGAIAWMLMRISISCI